MHLRKIVDITACEYCHVVCCGILLGTWQTMRVIKMAIRHAELLCCVIHQLDKHFSTARDMLSNGNTRVIP